MNPRTLKGLFILLVLLFLACVIGASYFYIESQDNKIREKEEQIQDLKKTELSLKGGLWKFQNRVKESVYKNRDLRGEVKQFNEQKKIILDQVRNSVAEFDAFRRGSTEEIGRLKETVTSLESKKTNVEKKLETLVASSTSERQDLQSQVKNLSEKIDHLKTTETKLVENLDKKDQTGIAVETAKLHYNLGNFYFKNNDYKNAAAEYKKALFYRPDDADANYNLAVVSDDFLDDRAVAMYRYRQYLELRPNARDRKKISERILDLQLRDQVINEPIIKRDSDVFKGGENGSRFGLIGDKS